MTPDETGARRRRRRRGGRGRGGGERREDAQGAASAQPQRKQAPAEDEWKWLSFPVFFAFGLGIVVMGLFYPEPLIGFFVFVGGVTVVAFGVAHIAARRWAQSRRRRS